MRQVIISNHTANDNIISEAAMNDNTTSDNTIRAPNRFKHIIWFNLLKGLGCILHRGSYYSLTLIG